MGEVRTNQTRPGQRAIRLALVGMLYAIVAACGMTVHADDFVQPTQVDALHRSGQTFITWQECEGMIGERYRIYRADAPIDADVLAAATLIAEVPEGSSVFFANRRKYYSGDWAPRYVDRYVIEDFDAELGDNTGLVVWTLSEIDLGQDGVGEGYYAVTTVVSGTECLAGWDDNVVGPVQESVDAPSPVEIDGHLTAGWHSYIQYMDLREWNATFHAPRSGNSYYGLDPDAPEVDDALQYAYDYAVYEPEVTPEDADQPIPVVISLHAWQGNVYGAPTSNTAKSWLAYQIVPIDVSETWWYGFAEDHDYRAGGAPRAGDAIVNYTEARVLRMLDDLMRDPPGPPVDPERIYISGYSMGATGALGMAIRYPHVFAAAYACKPMTEYRTSGGWLGNVSQVWGGTSSNLPIRNLASSSFLAPLAVYDGLGVYDWQSHQYSLATRRGEECTPMGLVHAGDDTNVTWFDQGAPLYSLLDGSGLCWGASLLLNGHDYVDHEGLPATMAKDEGGVPFSGLQVVRSETVPGLRVSADEWITPTESCELNRHIAWSASWDAWDEPPVDAPFYWEMSLRLMTETLSLDPYSVPMTQTIDVTPRRLQAFVVSEDATYRWRNRRLEDGRVVGSGEVVPDADGLLTLRDQEITVAGNRLTLWRTGLECINLPLLVSD